MSIRTAKLRVLASCRSPLFDAPAHQRYDWWRHADLSKTLRTPGRRGGARGTALVGTGQLADGSTGRRPYPEECRRPWQPRSLDATPVMGIATTVMATMDMLPRASKDKTNPVVTLEPTFFSRLDAQPDPAPGAGRVGVFSPSLRTRGTFGRCLEARKSIRSKSTRQSR